jgi:hypothetical protein
MPFVILIAPRRLQVGQLPRTAGSPRPLLSPSLPQARGTAHQTRPLFTPKTTSRPSIHQLYQILFDPVVSSPVTNNHLTTPPRWSSVPITSTYPRRRRPTRILCPSPRTVLYQTPLPVRKNTNLNGYLYDGPSPGCAAGSETEPLPPSRSGTSLPRSRRLPGRPRSVRTRLDSFSAIICVPECSVCFRLEK